MTTFANRTYPDQVFTLDALLEFMANPDTNELLPKHFEVVEGKIVQMSPTSRSHGSINTRIAQLLSDFIYYNKVGEIFTAETGFELKNKPLVLRVADTAFVSNENLDKTYETSGFYIIAPDLAVEVISPGNSTREMRNKLSQYFEAGCKLAWYVYPKKQEVRIYTSGDYGDYNLKKGDEEIDGGSVLPFFRCKVSDFFNLDFLPMYVNHFFTLEELNENLADPSRAKYLPQHFEIIDGKMIGTPVLSRYENYVNGNIFSLLKSYSQSAKLDKVPIQGISFQLKAEPLNIRYPDIGFVSKKEIFKGSKQERFLAVVPDLAVEVFSPSLTEGGMQIKIADYFQAGCKVVWVIYPEQQAINVYRAGEVTPSQVLTGEDTISGEDIVQGFACQVSQFFD